VPHEHQHHREAPATITVTQHLPRDGWHALDQAVDDVREPLAIFLSQLNGTGRSRSRSA
jgi:hypothetical protein